MKLSGMVMGVAMAALLLALLGLSRLLAPAALTPDLELRELEITSMPEPPPPPPEDEPPPEAPPPPPSLTEVVDLPDPSRVAIPKADVPMDLAMPVDPFFTDVAPAPLPQPVVRREAVRPKTSPQPSRVTQARSTSTKPRPKPVPQPRMKSHYSMGELDSQPRLLRHGRATFPSELRRRGVSQGTVTFEVEISGSGSVSIRRVISSTHPELVAAARRVAAGSRFSSPMKNGQKVKVIKRWPIVIRK